jgi:hypothetical protein
MNRTIPTRIVVALAVTIATTLGLAGCEDKPTFDPKLQYTAETLAQEFLYDYSQLKTVDGGAVRSKVVKPTAEATKDAAKPGATTKKAPTASLDELIAETRRKATLVRDTNSAEACKKVVEAARNDTSIPEGDKKVIADALAPAG